MMAAVAAPLAVGTAAVPLVLAGTQTVSAQDVKQARKDAGKRLKNAQVAVKKAEKRLKQATKKSEGVEEAEAELASATAELKAARAEFNAAKAASSGNNEQPPASTEAQVETQVETEADPAKAVETILPKKDPEPSRKAKTEAPAESAEDTKAVEKQIMEDEERRKRRAERRERRREQEAKAGSGNEAEETVEIIPESEAVGTRLDNRQEQQVERLRRKLREQRREIRDLEQAETEKGEEVVRRTRDGRVIVRQDGQLVIRHNDDNDRFLRRARDVVVEDLPRGRTRTTITRPNGVQIITVKNRRGEIIYRVRKNRNGREIVLIDNRDHRPRPGVNFRVDLPRLIVPIPRDEYIVDLERADRQRLRDTLLAPPVEEVERVYTLDEVRQNERLREKVRRIDLDTVTFETGSAEISPSQVQSLAEIGYAMEDVLADNPDAVFFVEGHTDAVGSDYSNLELSDRRAESIAIVLSENFDIPPENLITQGYGEEFLKIPTDGPERANRRVTIRPITDLIRENS